MASRIVHLTKAAEQIDKGRPLSLNPPDERLHDSEKEDRDWGEKLDAAKSLILEVRAQMAVRGWKQGNP